MGFLDTLRMGRLREGLSKTRENVFGKVSRLLTASTKVDNALLEEVEEILLAGDVGVETTTEVIEKITLRVKKEGYRSSEELIELLKDEIERSFLDGSGSGVQDPFEPVTEKPHVIIVVGVNGVGKTTTIGKLAYQYRQKGMKVLLAAADTFRAAATEQLEIWARRAGAELIRQSSGTDPGAVVHDALSSSVARGIDILIIDTAGRLHTRVNLMEELKKINRVLKKQVSDAPHETLLVLDATAGQNSIHQARQFQEAIGLTGLVLTKLDGTAKGGIVIAVNRSLKIPVRFVGVGEELEDLQPFDREAFVDALFGK